MNEESANPSTQSCHGEMPDDQKAISETVVNNTTVLLRFLNEDTSCKLISRAWFEFTGLVHKNDYPLTEHIHPEFQNSYEEAWQLAVSQKKQFEINYLLRHRSGQYRWIFESTKPVYDSEGRCEGFLSTGIDIHDQKDREELLKSQWSSVLRGSFHDLRASIGIVSGATSLLQLMEKKADRDNAVGMIQRNVRQMQNVMDQLLTHFGAQTQ
jgi:PAS domain S-box-containing protein